MGVCNIEGPKPAIARRLFIVLLTVLSVLLLYYFHAVRKETIVFSHFFYLPALLASYWWQWRGMLVSALLAILLILSREFYFTGPVPIDEYLRAGALLMTSGIVALLSEKNKLSRRDLLKYQKKLSCLSSSLVTAEESEKRRIALALHDTLAQDLVLIRLKLDALSGREAALGISAELRELSQVIKNAIVYLRSLMSELCSPALYELGLEQAISEWLSLKLKQEQGIDYEFIIDSALDPLPETQRVVLFQGVREALINVIKHAGAKHVTVRIACVRALAVIEIRDDGCGFVPEIQAFRYESPGHFGLFSIRERLQNIGGRLEITSRPGQGTCLSLQIPLPPASSQSVCYGT